VTLVVPKTRSEKGPLRGAVLDVDGTLIDSNDAHATAYARAFADEHLQISFERIRPLIGIGAEKLLSALGIDPHSAAAKRASKQKKEHFANEFLPGLRACRGARDLLEAMKKRGIRRVVATSASSDEIGQLLRAARIDDLIEAEATSSDAEASKPDPDIVEAAVARVGLPREELAMLGDTPYDVEAARRAGLPIVALRTGGWADGDLGGAVAVYDDPADLLARFDDSIFARR
jgi:HAD superfamily hydrolase (TIGR01549 family)